MLIFIFYLFICIFMLCIILKCEQNNNNNNFSNVHYSSVIEAKGASFVEGDNLIVSLCKISYFPQRIHIFLSDIRFYCSHF